MQDTASSLYNRFREVRKRTLEICSFLERDDYMIQATQDTSPPKWHLGHTSWFFENFILKPYQGKYREFNEMFSTVFNSYYNQVGYFIPKTTRMLLSRPSLEDVLAYRNHVESEIEKILLSDDNPHIKDVRNLVLLGINHEEQHQELLIMDIKENMYRSPFQPPFGGRKVQTGKAGKLKWVSFKGGISYVGAEKSGFSFDNEHPRHKVYLYPYQIASRLVTNGEYLEFILKGGYEKPAFWLSDGWAVVSREKWRMPHYWEKRGEIFYGFTPSGWEKLNMEEPVCHLSYYEADAFARWSGCRLPTEEEWENAFTAKKNPQPRQEYAWHPSIQHSSDALQGPGECWEWTSSSYSPYPGFTPLSGAIGEYNGKFMSQQMVLRGDSAATPPGHSRVSYRNFYHPESRWQFSGIRLCRSANNAER